MLDGVRGAQRSDWGSLIEFEVPRGRIGVRIVSWSSRCPEVGLGFVWFDGVRGAQRSDWGSDHFG